ncbi:MAG: ketoacyl-ACP synthase III [Vampirovibrionales bacterium]|nr:ketoacyl-ACP synthase III [Vampirovibrionales bacterium]
MKSIVSNVKIVGLAASVPKVSQSILDSFYGEPADRLKFMKTTGVENRRLSTVDQCTSDFCFAAADRLLQDLQWDRSSVDLLIFVTQTPDYILPATAITLQDRLGLSRECAAFDINLGCSGYTYGLSVVSSMMAGGGFKKALLLVGDTSSKGILPSTRHATPPLFGDCGTATALECQESAPSMYFHLASDGSGKEAIMHRYGAYRHPFHEDTFSYEALEGGYIEVNTQFVLDGLEVFNFSVREIPPAVKALMAFSGQTVETVDGFVFHQANMLMNEMIRKNLKIPPEKHPYTLKKYGNTSSATIPLTLVSELRDKLQSQPMRLVLSGFGVGLSWGTACVETNSIVCPEVIEL